MTFTMLTCGQSSGLSKVVSVRYSFCRTTVSYTHLILGDIGGWSGFVSSVYLTGPGPFLYHLYDDRGLDVLGSSRAVSYTHLQKVGYKR